MRHLIAIALLCVPCFAQSGTVSIPSNYWQHHNLGPGVGALQIPPASVAGVTRLYVEVDLAIDYTFEWEIGPYPAGSGNPVQGYFWGRQDRVDAWSLTAGLAGLNPEIVLTGGRVYPAPMILEHTYPTTPWDGLIDWQGPTWLAVNQTKNAPIRSATFTLNILDNPPRDLWLNVKGASNSVSSVSGHGIAYFRGLDPWRAVVTYQYLP